MDRSSRISRRQFVRVGSAATLGALSLPYIIPSSALGQGPGTGANQRITMGFIGAGGKGMHNLDQLMQFPEVQVVAVCDVDRRHLTPAQDHVHGYYTEKTGKEWRGCGAYVDYRDLVARDDIDAVCVSTPDHWHALTTVAAADAGMHVYCEKPLANSVGEGRAMVEAVTRHKVVYQNGSHERSTSSIRSACELVRNGYIGDLKSIRINLPCSDPHHLEAQAYKQIPPPEPVPPELDWNHWLGHTPEVPYAERRCHFWWRFILSYGGGEMTDRGAHVIDIGQLGAGMDDTGPVEIEAKGEQTPGSLYNAWWNYSFTNTYANGLKLIGVCEDPRGLKFEGSEGSIFVHIHGGALEAEPASLLDIKLPEEKMTLGRSPGHHRNFVEAILGQAQPMAPAEAGHRTASICHLNNIAMKIGRPLKWDPVAERVTNVEEANDLLTPRMRMPWKLAWRGRRY